MHPLSDRLNWNLRSQSSFIHWQNNPTVRLDCPIRASLFQTIPDRSACSLTVVEINSPFQNCLPIIIPELLFHQVVFWKLNSPRDTIIPGLGGKPNLHKKFQQYQCDLTLESRRKDGLTGWSSVSKAYLGIATRSEREMSSPTETVPLGSAFPRVFASLTLSQFFSRVNFLWLRRHLANDVYKR